MIRLRVVALGLVLTAVTACHTMAAAPSEPTVLNATSAPMVTDPALGPASDDIVSGAIEAPASPTAAALRQKLAALPTDGTAQEIKESAVLSDFYKARSDAPLWVRETGLTDAAVAIIDEIKKAGEWGLDAKDFTLPDIKPVKDGAKLEPAEVADAEVTLALAILKYGRYARGGRISDPTILLNSNLDRKPQLIDPEIVIEGIASSDTPDAYLRGLNPQHPQFQRLRKAYLAAHGHAAERLLANMEEWRWMPEDLGEVHILANVPEYMVYLYKDGKPIHSERIVVGETDKQTTIFTRNLKTIVFKPMWRVPESIKVRELQPNLRRGGSMFRKYDLRLETKDGQPLDYHDIDWFTADIRDYEVVQPPGRKNVMGVVKFTFPSQHTIFMHDTVDKWMFAQSKRTLSHGCLRLRNPMRMAEKVLAEDKGWDANRVEQTMRDGPASNEIVIDKEIPMHLVYFTAWVDDDGRVRTFADIYGHEKRITQALQGKWSEINVGRNHLAPVGEAPPSSLTTSSAGAPPTRRKQSKSVVDMVGQALGGGY